MKASPSDRNIASAPGPRPAGRGALWLVIRTKQGAKSIMRDIAPLFTEVETLSRKQGYRIFRCSKQEAHADERL